MTSQKRSSAKSADYHHEREIQRKESDPYRSEVQKRIREDLKEIRTLADVIKKASRSAEKLMDAPPVDDWEWQQEMNKIHDARKKIRWIICDKRGRFV